MKALNLTILAAAALGVAACSSPKASESIAGNYRIAQIELNDTISLRPAEITPDEPQTVMFTDSTYHFHTNCNLVQGDYTLTGDSISFGMGLSTRMACPDMQVEDALTQLLPQLTSISQPNDSTLRISADNPSVYILLNKEK